MTETTIRPFLMFEVKAEEAMNFYVGLFPDGKVLESSATAPRGRALPARS